MIKTSDQDVIENPGQVPFKGLTLAKHGLD